MDNLLNKIHFADCLDVLRQIPDGSVDLMLTDPPYNTTACEWEYEISFEALWGEWRRVVKPNGAFVFTASQPFTTDLINSNRAYFKYELVWDKGRPSNFMLSKHQVLKMHENIIVFYKNQPTFNPQKVNRNKWDKRLGSNKNTNEKGKIIQVTGQKRVVPTSSDDEKLDGSIIRILRKVEPGHPTQKPTDLFRYLIRTYSNPGDVVFDGYGGSGTTAIAAQMENRKFIVCENHFPYFEASTARLANLVAAPYLFTDCG